jgi:hypothetical protein
MERPKGWHLSASVARISSRRVDRLMRSAISAMDLDLTGITVLTEAASGFYSTTCLMAGLAGARRVVAITRDSEWGPSDVVVEEVQASAERLGIADRLQFESEVTPLVVRNCNLVTNLGFVRPLNDRMMSALPNDAAVSLMCEPWEVRLSDVDIVSAIRRAVAVAGTNESHMLVRTLDYLGPLAGKLMLEAKKEIVESEVLVVASEPFAKPIRDWLLSAGASRVDLKLPSNSSLEVSARFGHLDAVLVAHMGKNSLGVGEHNSLSPSLLADFGAALLVIAGDLDPKPFRDAGVEVFPFNPRSVGTMWITTSAVGPRPVVNLHCAGLKVGELMIRARRMGLSPDEAASKAVASGIGLAI